MSPVTQSAPPICVQPQASPALIEFVGAGRFEPRDFQAWCQRSLPSESSALCRLGPARWLLMAGDSIDPRCFPPPPAGAYLIDARDAYTTVRVSGVAAQGHLQRFVLRDLRPNHFRPACAQRLRFVEIAIVLQRRHADEFLVHVPRSYESYVVGLLDAASRAIPATVLPEAGASSCVFS